MTSSLVRIAIGAVCLGGFTAAAAQVYLNDANMSVVLGPSMAPEPFANRTAAASLASIIDAPSKDAEEFHTQSTHVWVSGGSLEVEFDLGREYDLDAVHFWNYHGEGYDVDTIELTFLDSSRTPYAVVPYTILDPTLGNNTGSDSTPILAEDILLRYRTTRDGPKNVRYVVALISGSNGQVDFSNLGFSGAPSGFLQSELGVYIDGQWFIDVDGDYVYGGGVETFGWGSPGDIPVRGDWNGDGFIDFGVFSGGAWFLDMNGDRSFDPATDYKGWGAPGWIPMVGDWNGDGKTDLGVVDPSNSTWFRDLNGDFTFDPATEILGWGSPGDTPVVGDWNGDGKDAVGVFSGGTWFIDLDGQGVFDPGTDIYGWGVAGWTPVVGDWDGDGADELGVVTPDSTWFRDMNGDFSFDPATDMLGWGSAGDTPVIGDWNGDGADDVGVYSGGTWFIDSNGNQMFDPGTDIYGWGAPGWTPVPGTWK